MRQTLLLLVVTSLCSLSVGRRRVYHFINENKTWTDAQKFCSEHYTDLATVDEQTNVSYVCPKDKDCRDAWVRLNFTQPSNVQWKWIGSTHKPYEPVWQNVPTNQNESNCASVNKPKDVLLWSSRSCGEKNRYVCCEGLPNDLSCDDTHTTNTWCEALHDCRNRHMTLVSGPDQVNDSFTEIGSMGPNLYWWIGLFRANPSWSEDDFCYSQQNNSCAKLNENNNWKRDNCTKEHPFICYDDHMVLVKQNMTWEDALDYCRKNHHELAVMTDQHQLEMVAKKSKMADTEFIWVGLHFSCFFEEWMWVNGHWVSSDDNNWKKKNERPDCNVSGAMERGQNEWVKKSSKDQYNFVCTLHC